MEFKCLWSIFLSLTVLVSIVVIIESFTDSTSLSRDSNRVPRTVKRAALFLEGKTSGEHLVNERQSRFFSPFSLLTLSYQTCRYDEHRNGTCMRSGECRTSGGKYRPSWNNCTLGTASLNGGVCCLHELTCGMTMGDKNSTYFVNENFPNNSNVAQTCDLLVPTNGACFIRLDFHRFTVHPPVNGSCVADQFLVPELPGTVPMICGQNRDTHMYIFVAERTEITLRFNLGEWTGNRHWLIGVSRIDCNSPWRPHGNNCLQYFTDKSGSIKSFNFDETSPNESGMIAGEDYLICLRQTRVQCYNKWHSDFFSLSPSGGGRSSVVGDACTENFLTISRGHDITQTAITYDRFCGEVLSAVKNSSQPADIYSDVYPFDIRVHTSNNYSSLRHGFNIHYRQLQCLQPPTGMYGK